MKQAKQALKVCKLNSNRYLKILKESLLLKTEHEQTPFKIYLRILTVTRLICNGDSPPVNIGEEQGRNADDGVRMTIE